MLAKLFFKSRFNWFDVLCVIIVAALGSGWWWLALLPAAVLSSELEQRL